MLEEERAEQADRTRSHDYDLCFGGIHVGGPDNARHPARWLLRSKFDVDVEMTYG